MPKLSLGLSTGDHDRTYSNGVKWNAGVVAVLVTAILGLSAVACGGPSATKADTPMPAPSRTKASTVPKKQHPATTRATTAPCRSTVAAENAPTCPVATRVSLPSVIGMSAAWAAALCTPPVCGRPSFLGRGGPSTTSPQIPAAWWPTGRPWNCAPWPAPARRWRFLRALASFQRHQWTSVRVSLRGKERRGPLSSRPGQPGSDLSRRPSRMVSVGAFRALPG